MQIPKYGDHYQVTPDWGAGIYINEINISDDIDIIYRLDGYQNNGECFCLSILLNSGDGINVLAEKVTYSQV